MNREVIQGASFIAPATVTLTASASDADGTVARVEFFEGANLIAGMTQAPYSAPWQVATPGSYTLFAKATDDRGAVTQAQPVHVTVKANTPPSVTLTSPAQGATFKAPATIALAATASDVDGTVAKVEFLQGATLLATLTQAPYTFDWVNVGAGSYTLTARATDDKGAVTTSAPVTVSVASAQAAVYYIFSDHLNTPRVITDQQQRVVWRWDNTDPFGGNVPDEDPDGDGQKFTFNLRFPGQYFDKETGLHYNWMRDYSSEIGRYIEPDPIGLKSGLNLYTYALSRPLSVVDPDGRRPYDFQIKYGGGVGHIIVGGAVYTATIKDVQSGATCKYQIRCFGLGVGLPEFGVTSKPVRFDDGQPCSKCSDFTGLGYIGGVSGQVGGGVTIGGGVQIPNGPFIANDLLDFDYGAFRVGVSHNACYFALQ